MQLRVCWDIDSKTFNREPVDHVQLFILKHVCKNRWTFQRNWNGKAKQCDGPAICSNWIKKERNQEFGRALLQRETTGCLKDMKRSQSGGNMTSGSGLFEANKATCALINYGDSVSLTSYKLDFEYGNNSAIANPEYLLINTPQLKKHHVRNPNFGLYVFLNYRPLKPLLNYQHGRFWG